MIMEANLNQSFIGFDGKPFKNNQTISDALGQALFSGLGVGNKPEEKYSAYKLCHKILNSKDGNIEFDIDERKLLKNVACASLTPGAYGQVVELLKLEEV